MNDAEKLIVYADAVDELRRLQKTTRKPPNVHEARELKRAEDEVDRLTALYLPRDEAAATVLPPAPSA